jgi:uncharacterized protein involved in exopolysaccharide biosynthesis
MMKNKKENAPFDFLDLIREMARRWLLIAVLMILGGVGGLLVSFLQPAVYESNAALSVTIDYTQTGALSDVQEDQAMRGVGSVLLSDALIEETLQQLNDQGGSGLKVEVFRSNAFADRGDFRWVIRYRDSDPGCAFRVANQWAESAQAQIKDDLAHALTAESYLRMLDDLQRCLQSGGAGFTGNFCGFGDADSLLNEIARLSGKIQHEKQLSQGLFYALSVNLVEDAVLPAGPVRHQTAVLVLAGAMCGFIIGFGYALIRFFFGGAAD